MGVQGLNTVSMYAGIRIFEFALVRQIQKCDLANLKISLSRHSETSVRLLNGVHLKSIPNKWECLLFFLKLNFNL